MHRYWPGQISESPWAACQMPQLVADVVIMIDEPSKIATAYQNSKENTADSLQNINLAVIVKTAVLILSAFGITALWAAIFADVG